MEMQDNIEGGTVRLSLSGDLPNGHNRNDGNSVERIETQEKRTRFSLSHDEGIESINCITYNHSPPFNRFSYDKITEP